MEIFVKKTFKKSHKKIMKIPKIPCAHEET